MSAAESSPCPLEIIIIGAGLSGLSAAIAAALAQHKVIVLEAARELAEVVQVLMVFFMSTKL